LIGVSEKRCARLSRRSDQSAWISGEARTKKPGAVSRPGIVGVQWVRRAYAVTHREFHLQRESVGFAKALYPPYRRGSMRAQFASFNFSNSLICGTASRVGRRRQG